MVPGLGISSNSSPAVLEDWTRASQGLESEEELSEQVQTILTLFETLAEWNEYLEGHVPYFQEADYDL